MIIQSPTGKGIRSDPAGDGHFGASRGSRIHNGADFECVPDQLVTCPIESGVLVRESRPYADDSRYKGVVIRSDRIHIKMFYCEVLDRLVGTKVRQSQPIAVAQDISKKYGGGMKPHIHLQIDKIDPTLLMEVD